MILKELPLGELGRSKSPILRRESSFQYEPCSVEGMSMYLGQYSTCDQDFKDCRCREQKGDSRGPYSIVVLMGVPHPASTLGKTLTAAVCHFPSHFCPYI